MVLDEIGLPHVPIVVMDQGEEFAAQIKSFGAGFYRTFWELIVIVDFMQKMLRETRPYEVNRGEAERVYGQCLKDLVEVAERRGDHFAAAAEMRRRLEAVPVDRSQERPLIGVVGEIYVRSNQFANNFIVRRLEACGAEVALPPMQEWINYIAFDRREMAREQRHVGAITKEWIGGIVSRRSEARIAKAFRGAIRHMPREAPVSEVLKLGSEYLSPTVKGEAILSMGRAVEYAHHGFNGVVNVAPFGCMPGSIVNSLLEKFRHDYGLPVLKLDYDGLQQASEGTALEAFVHQARQHMATRRTEQAVRH